MPPATDLEYRRTCGACDCTRTVAAEGRHYTARSHWFGQGARDMVKSTVRSPETVMDHVEQMVEEGSFSSKSEFQRFAVEYVLSEVTDYDPEIVDFEEICAEALRDGPVIQGAESTTQSEHGFIDTAARVRQLAIRGDVATAIEYVDTQYPPTDPRSMLLEDLLTAYQDGSGGR